MPARPLALVLAGVLACAAAPAAAQPALPQDPAAVAGEPVAEVVLQRGDRVETDPRWLALIETEPGRPLSLRDVRDTLLHFFHTGQFEGVDVTAERAPAGLRLRYRLLPVRVVRGYSFTGDLGLDAGELRRAIDERFGDRPVPARVADLAAETVAARLREHGFASATVTASLEGREGADTATLRFAVAAGPRSRIGRVLVTGDGIESEARVRELLGVETGDFYDGPAIDRRLEALRDGLRQRGYYEASAVVRTTPRPDEPVVDLVADVQAGPRVTLRFEGDPIPEARRADLVPIEREASVDEDLLEDSKRRIERYLKDLGHWNSDVIYRREPGPGTLAVVFTVKAGEVYRVARVEVEGVQAFTRADIDAMLQLDPNDLAVMSALDARTAALTERYRRAGFRDVRIDQFEEEIVQPPGTRGGRVAVRLVVSEGERIRVRDVRITGARAVPEAAIREVLQLTAGAPFYEPLLAADRDAISTVYLNRGFDRVRVESNVSAVPDEPAVRLTYAVSEGAQVRVGRILIVGNRRTAAATIERALTLRRGDPLGLAEIFESQRRLRALGLFRRVTITDVGDTGESTRDLVVTVEEAAPTSIGYGAGVEAGRYLRQDEPGGQASERIELAGRGFFEIGRQNLWGSNRSVNLFTRLSLRPSGAPERVGTSDFGFNEYRVLVSFRDPRVFDLADTRLTGYFEQAVRSSFNFVRRGILAEAARRLRDRVTVAGSYSLSEVRLFDERIAPADRPDIDRLFPQLRLSKFSSASRFDTRDDVLDPTTGMVVGGDADVAARAIGSEVGFVKGYAELFAYRPLSKGSRVVMAGGARLGLAKGFVRTAPRLNEQGEPVLGPGGEPVFDQVSDLPASERFFAGGDTTVRGFARDGLGDVGTLDPNGFPTGGNALVIVNAELRAPLWRDLGGVVFLDAGNVFRRVGDLDLGALRASAGFGLRYKSPIGPVRVDLGFKLDEAVTVPGRREPGYAVHFSIGQAF